VITYTTLTFPTSGTKTVSMQQQLIHSRSLRVSFY
jgi:hypothetical protein